jgi:hypothetical protein
MNIYKSRFSSIHLEATLYNMLFNLSVGLTGKDEEVYKLGCGTLMMYVSKVLEQPSVPRYRKIATSNASYKSIVLPLEGHIEVLIYIYICIYIYI